MKPFLEAIKEGIVLAELTKKKGDLIEIDIPRKKLNVKLTASELKRRKKGWKPKPPKIKTGWLARYARMVTSASHGAILK